MVTVRLAVLANFFKGDCGKQGGAEICGNGARPVARLLMTGLECLIEELRIDKMRSDDSEG